MNNSEIEKFLKQNGKSVDRDALLKAKQTGDASALIEKLDLADKQKLNEILSDKQKLNEVLKSPKAQALLKLFGGKTNG